MKKKNILKTLFGKLHLWLGFTSGLLVFIISITGCLYAFQDEIQNLTQSYRFVERENKEVLVPSVIKAIAEKHLPDKKIHGILYGGAEKAVQVIFYNFEPNYYYIIYVNPYTGEVLKVKDVNKDFFRIVLDGHFYLWLPPSIGQPIVATATLVFVVMLISGIILWWPKNKHSVKQKFTIKWSARWRRKNYDLHNVLGFYASWLAIIFAVTGLVWGFEWFARTYYRSAGGEKSLAYVDPPSDTTKIVQHNRPAIDKVWDIMRTEYPLAETIEVHVPETSSSSIAANANADSKTYWQIDYRYFDQYTLKELPVNHIYGRIGDANGADKLFRMNYDIHTGAILGLPGKVLAFLISLICASLPITGFYIWWGRRNKQEVSSKKLSVKRNQKKVFKSRVAESQVV